MRQRWLKGQVVPEYKVIISAVIGGWCFVTGMTLDRRWRRRWPGYHHRSPLARHRSVNVLPEFLLERIGEHEEHAQEYQHVDAERFARLPGGLADVDQEIDEVRHQAIVLGGRHLPRLGEHEPLHFVPLDLLLVMTETALYRFRLEDLLAL